MDEQDREVDLLLALNCPYINKSDSKENIRKWVDKIGENKEEKQLLLDWIFQILGESAANTSQSLLNVGVLGKSQECQNFLSGSLSKDYERSVWESLFDLLHMHTQCSRTKEDSIVIKSRQEDFLDTLTSEVNLSLQLEKPVSILDYALEKEMSKQKSGVTLPRSVIPTIMNKVQQERDSLNQKLETSFCQLSSAQLSNGSVSSAQPNNGTASSTQLNGSSEDPAQPERSSDLDIQPSSDLEVQPSSDLDKLTLECERTVSCVEQFTSKYKSQLKPVLNSSKELETVTTDSEVVRFNSTMQDLAKFLHGSDNMYHHIDQLQQLKTRSIVTNFSSLS